MTGKPANVRLTLGRLFLLALLVGLVPVSGVVPSAHADPADHLIISEVLIKTRAPLTTFGSPHILIVNPTAGDLDLSQVYLTDGTTSPSAFYYNLPLGTPAAANPGGGNGGDFHARFPAGYTLAAGDTLAISITGSTEYQGAYGRLPDFELYEDGTSPDAVPELLEAFPGSIDAGSLVGGSNTPALSDVGESLVLYTWDGSSDLVQDLDYIAWGNYAASLVDKSGVTIGMSTYLDDTPTGSQDVTATPNFRQALRRAGIDEGTETPSGGNGLTGHDETSENLTTTWSIVDVGTGHNVPAAPASFYPSAPIVTDFGQSPTEPYAGEEATVQITALSYSAISSVTFHYSVDGGAYSDVSGTLDGDNYVASLPAQSEGAVVTWYATVQNADGGEAVYPANAPVSVNSYTVIAVPPPGQGAVKLLITEVSVDPIEAEFIEIHNPQSFEVDLSDYYLTDAIYYSSFGNQLYWQIAWDTVNRDAVGGGFYNDFTARFPDGYMLPAGATITIAIRGSANFEATFGFSPDLELYEDGATADDIPEFRSVFNTGTENSIVTPGGDDRGYPELEEYWGEPVILYHYEEGADFVTDIDWVMWRQDVGDYPFTFDKSGITIGSHTYADDTPVDEQTSPSGQVGSGESYTRVVSDETFQPRTGSNGVDGRNETGEDLNTTIQVTAWSPGVYEPVVLDLDSVISLRIPAKTFIPTMGEVMPVEFSADSSFETKVRIFDLEGRVVRTIYETRRDGAAGLLSSASWDGRNDNFERVKAGMYIVHVLAVDPATGEHYTETAPVVVATRLSR